MQRRWQELAAVVWWWGHATHPQLADESACLLHRQLALLPHDALNGLEDVPGHGDIPADVDVASLLLQRFEHGLGQLLL